MEAKGLAIAGKMGSGKSHLAKRIKELKPHAEILSFAGGVKRIAAELFGVVVKDRQSLIQIAEKMKEIDGDVWVNLVIKQARALTHPIVDDLRFHNEYERLKALGYVIVKIDVDESQRQAQLKEKYGASYDDHVAFFDDPSENQVASYTDEKFDHVLRTPGDMAEFLIWVQLHL